MIAFIIKEFRHLLRDPRSLLILIGMPLAQILIFGYAIKTDLNESDIAIVRMNNDKLSDLAIQHLDASKGFHVKYIWDHPSQIAEAFRKGEIRLAVVLDNNLESKILQGYPADIQVIGDASDPNTANLLVQHTQGTLRNVYREYLQKNASTPVVQVSARMLFNEENRSVFMFIPGTIVIILMLLSAMMTSISLAREKETGTLELLLVSPLRPHQIILGKVVPYMGLSLINACTILLLSKFLFEMPFRGSLPLLMSETLLFIILALCIGLYISTIARTQQVAMLLSMFALMLPTILLSGFIFPIENMPLGLQYLSALIPARWFVEIIRGIMIRGVGIEILWKETLILAGMVCIFMLLCVKNFKIRLE